MEYEEESASRLHLRSRLGSIYSLLPFNTARKERRDKDREREREKWPWVLPPSGSVAAAALIKTDEAELRVENEADRDREGRGRCATKAPTSFEQSTTATPHGPSLSNSAPRAPLQHTFKGTWSLLEERPSALN